MSDRSKAELLDEIEFLKRELDHTKRQLRKKSHQASVYSRMMHGAMRHLCDEWFPFRGFLEARSGELAAPGEIAGTGDVAALGDDAAVSEVSDDNKLAIRERWNLIQKRISARVNSK